MTFGLRGLIIIVLLMVGCQLQGGVLLSTETPASKATFQSESSTQTTHKRHHIAKANWRYFSDVEPMVTSLRNVINTVHKFRWRKLTEEIMTFKAAMNKSLRQNIDALIADRSKEYYSDKTPHYSSKCCEYYVFALRRILI